MTLQRLERGKVGKQIGAGQLEDMFGAQQVFERMFAQVLQAYPCWQGVSGQLDSGNRK